MADTGISFCLINYVHQIKQTRMVEIHQEFTWVCTFDFLPATKKRETLLIYQKISCYFIILIKTDGHRSTSWDWIGFFCINKGNCWNPYAILKKRYHYYVFITPDIYWISVESHRIDEPNTHHLIFERPINPRIFKNIPASSRIYCLLRSAQQASNQAKPNTVDMSNSISTKRPI